MENRLKHLSEAFSGQSVLVTGSTGGLGKELVAILARMARLHVLVRDKERMDPLWRDLPIAVHEGTLGDQTLLDGLCSEVTTVFHLASYAPSANEKEPEENPLHWDVTVEGTRNLLTAAKQGTVRKLVFASSTRVIDGSETLYARAKQEAEKLVLDAQGSSLDVTVLRLAPLYGFPDRGNIASMIRSIRAGRFPPLPDMGDRRSLLHYQDAIQALLLAAGNEAAAGRAYTVTDLQSYSTRGIYESVCRHSGTPMPGWRLPVWALKLAAKAGDLLQNVTRGSMPINTEKLAKLQASALFDGSEIERELGFEPVYTLEKALEHEFG